MGTQSIVLSGRIEKVRIEQKLQGSERMSSEVRVPRKRRSTRAEALSWDFQDDYRLERHKVLPTAPSIGSSALFL